MINLNASVILKIKRRKISIFKKRNMQMNYIQDLILKVE